MGRAGQTPPARLSTARGGALSGPLAIVWHSRTGAAEALSAAALAGARDAGVAGGDAAAVRLHASEATPDILLDAAAYLFVCPENLGTMSGAMKEMFDLAYYPLLGRIEGRAYATIIAAGSAGHGAQAQIDGIVTGWRLRRVAEPIIVNLRSQTPEAIRPRKLVPATDLAEAHTLGAALVEGVAMGIF